MNQLLETNKLITINSEEYIQFLYAITDKKKQSKAAKTIKEKVKSLGLPNSNIFPDYKNRLVIGDRTWSKTKNLNVYTDNFTGEKSMTGASRGSWERVYWYILEK